MPTKWTHRIGTPPPRAMQSLHTRTAKRLPRFSAQPHTHGWVHSQLAKRSRMWELCMGALAEQVAARVHICAPVTCDASLALRQRVRTRFRPIFRAQVLRKASQVQSIVGTHRRRASLPAR